MYNALNFQRFDDATVDVAAVRRALNLPDSAAVIGSVGRLTEQKGYHVLLNAIPAVLRQQPHARFVIVGMGEAAAALQSQAQQLGVADAVHFTGARSDVEQLLAALDIFVSSSLWEGLPTVLLEAMAAGVPVVATRVSGNVELVQPGQTGLLVPPSDPDALAEGLCWALGQREAMQSMAANARKQVRQHFSIEAIARQHEALYERLAG